MIHKHISVRILHVRHDRMRDQFNELAQTTPGPHSALKEAYIISRTNSSFQILIEIEKAFKWEDQDFDWFQFNISIDGVHVATRHIYSRSDRSEGQVLLFEGLMRPQQGDPWPDTNAGPLHPRGNTQYSTSEPIQCHPSLLSDKDYTYVDVVPLMFARVERNRDPRHQVENLPDGQGSIHVTVKPLAKFAFDRNLRDPPLLSESNLETPDLTHCVRYVPLVSW